MRSTIPFGYTPATGRFPSYADNRHLCTIGPTRSGKGATVIVQALAQVPHSTVVVDVKGQIAAVTARRRRAMGQKVIVINPFGMHGLPQHRYNPLAVFDIHDRNVVADVAALSQALILTQGREPYFDDTARDLVTTLNLHLIATRGRRATLGEMRRLLTVIAARGKAATDLLDAMSESPHRFVAEPVGRFRDAEARDIAAAVNTAITQTAFLDDPALTNAETGALSGSDFSFAELKDRPVTVYLILPGRYIDAYARFLRLLLTAAIDQVTARPEGRPVLMILDEFARLERLPAIESAFGFAAGFNLQLWPFLQDLPQLQALYGKKWMSVLANCGMTQFFTPVDLETAEYIQRRGGFYTGESRSRNFGSEMWKPSRGESRSESRVPLLPVERIMSMPATESLVFFAGRHDPLLANRVNYWDIPRLAGLFDPDPYHR